MRLTYSTTSTNDISIETGEDDHYTDQHDLRARAVRARLPSYAGWWTEVMNHHQTPQSLPDPTLVLSEGHVFQGQSSSQTRSSNPTASEVKKGYSNTFPVAPPTAVSQSSTTFATGTVSSLSQPKGESTLYHGFSIPVKPTPPGAEDCCMSGCAHCIYDIYEEDRQEYKQKLAKVLEEIEKAGLPPPPNNLTNGSDSPNTSGDSGKDGDPDMDPSMKAFLELEQKLKGS